MTFHARSAALVALVFLTAPARAVEAIPAITPAPPQDQGLPYTRSAQKFALAKLKNEIAVFAGSRYAWVKGYKVRLDPDDILHGEAVRQDGGVFVPAGFAGVLDLKEIDPPPAPEYLRDRWVYELALPPTKPDGVVQIGGHPYVSLADLARSKGLKVYENPRGLLVIGAHDFTFTDAESSLLDTVITMFDTPEKFADPDIATRSIPTLTRQGKWTDHVKVTPEQQKLLDGPETVWPVAPKSEYDLTGFDPALLGSAVPPPGVYPRVLFSPDDVPEIAARLKKNKLGAMALLEMDYLLKKTWWDPATSDGQVFQKLSTGDLANLKWAATPPGTPPDAIPFLFEGEKPGIYNSHVAYTTQCLTSMAYYCLITGDDAHGKLAATAIANLYKMREPLIDEWNAISDSEFGSSYTDATGTVIPLNGNGGATNGRGMEGIDAPMDLGLAFDFSGKWMTDAQKDLMRRIIVKATYGRRPYGQDGPTRFRDINWIMWDTPSLYALAAIEGLPGCDPEAMAAQKETVKAWLDWGIDSSGQIYESNGKTPPGLQFQMLSMVTLARRGDNLWGHPHWRKLMASQVQVVSPSGQVGMTSGTQYVPYGRSELSVNLADEMKAFFPGDQAASYLLAQIPEHFDVAPGNREWVPTPDLGAYEKAVPKLPNLRLQGPSYPAFAASALYNTDYAPATRAELNLPLDFEDPTYGLLSSYSDRTTNAAWMAMQVRANHWLGAGHHHCDAGMFYFSGLGVDWLNQSTVIANYEGKYHNRVLIDGVAGPGAFPARADYLGATIGQDASAATADLGYSYHYRWLTQPNAIWDEKTAAMGWELEPSPENLKIFAGTGRYKMRPWWSSYTVSNYIPTCRAPFDPVKYVFRTTGLVRGAHPYGFVVDDVKKDDASHLYQWVAMTGLGVWSASMPGLAPNQIVLAQRTPDPKEKLSLDAPKPPITPVAGEPLLLVEAVTPDPSTDTAHQFISVTTEAGPPSKLGPPQAYNRLTISHAGVAGEFKVFLLPFHQGEPLPSVTYDAAGQKATVTCQDQKDEFAFKAADDARTHVTITRAGETILELK